VREKVRVLYVCPSAHYPGHFASAAVHETHALKQADAEVTLITFCGLIGKTEVEVPHLKVLSHTRLTLPVRYLASFIRKWTLSRWLLVFFETFSTLVMAMRMKRKLNCDIIHLRDGEPFLFLPHLLSLPFNSYNWVISLTASNIYPPTRLQNIRQMLYVIGLKFLNSRLWKPLYRLSLARNRFLFITQNKVSKQDYESFLQDVFSERVIYVPLGVDSKNYTIPKEKARQYLGLPQGETLFLSFGATHSGKDLGTIFCALKDVSDVYLIHTGKQAFNLGSSPTSLAQKYNMLDRAIIKEYYIPEEEKPYYFFAADAVILSYTRQFSSTVSLIWEACRFATPVIASDNGQLKELVEAFQLGLLFSAQRPDSLRQAIMRFIELKPYEIQTLKDNCHRFSNEFSMEKWAQRCLEIYDSLLIR
jgi:glycosyltransferase involved in cell wall biosynthesis